MTPRPILVPALALSGLILACADQPTAPGSSDLQRLPGAQPAAASNSWVTRANLPSIERYGLTTAVVPNAAGQSVLYAIGGSAATGGSLSKVQAYNVATNSWSYKAPLPRPLHWTNGAGVINGKIYVSGGILGNNDFRAELYLYDPATNSWTEKRAMPTQGFRGVTGVINNRLYVVTDCEQENCADFVSRALYRYNPATDQWAVLPSPPHSHGWGYGGAIGGKLYVTGGSSALDVYDPATNTWSERKPRCRGAAGSASGRRWAASYTSSAGSRTTPTGRRRSCERPSSTTRPPTRGQAGRPIPRHSSTSPGAASSSTASPGSRSWAAPSRAITGRISPSAAGSGNNRTAADSPDCRRRFSLRALTRASVRRTILPTCRGDSVCRAGVIGCGRRVTRPGSLRDHLTLKVLARPMRVSDPLASTIAPADDTDSIPEGTAMFRPCSALLLLLGLATTAAAQTPNRSAWTLALSDFTVYGHTTYTPKLVLLPRIVYDTAQGMDSARVVDSVRVAEKTSEFAVGLSRWPAEMYCSGPTSAATQSLEPRALLDRIQLAARCGIRLVIVPPRRELTTTRRTVGLFSVDSAKQLTDRYAAELPADTLRKYRETILGLNLGDDYGCTRCWGGTPITQAQIAEWAAYTRAKLPGVPLGVRVTPNWVADYPPLAPLLDYVWAQYHTQKGEPQAYFDRAATIAQRLGLRVVMGVNVEDCYGVRTDACSAEDLVRYGTMAVRHPASCAFIGWRYKESTWRRPEIREAWEKLLEVARQRGPEECRRVGGRA